MVDQSYLYFVTFHLVLLFFATIMKFWKWLLRIAFCFLLSPSWCNSEKKNIENYTKEKGRYSFQKNVKFHFCLPFRLINTILSTNSLTFMHEDDVTPSRFLFWWYLHNHDFSGKKLISKNFARVGSCASEMSTKFWDFVAGMDFDY